MSEKEKDVSVDGSRSVYSKIDVHISSDKMVATVAFDHTDSNAHPTAEMIKKALEAKGVVFGLDEKAIEQGAKDQAEDERIKDDPDQRKKKGRGRGGSHRDGQENAAEEDRPQERLAVDTFRGRNIDISF